MKRISPYQFDNSDALEKLSKSTVKKSHKRISKKKAAILRQYNAYEIAEGDPWLIAPIRMSNILKKNLEGRFDSPPKPIEIIKKIRKKLSPDICPMCGSQSNGTVDHYLPKEHYPEFTIYTNNLVPMCNCNSFKGTIVKGGSAGQRILHPYYDDVLKERLLSLKISGSNLINPGLSLKIIYDATLPDYPSVEFHVEEIIEKTAIIEILAGKWETLMHEPSIIIPTLPERRIKLTTCKKSIKTMLDAKDREFNSKNNWSSILFHGILNNSDVIRIILQQHNRIYS